MGVYAQTNYTIECKNEKSAKEVLKKLKSIKPDEHGNTVGTDLECCGNEVSAFLDSGRIQNLEYQCEKTWEAVKDIKGVLSANFPFLSEADGSYFENTEPEPKDTITKLN